MGGSEDPCTSSFGCGNETSLDISSCCGSYQVSTLITNVGPSVLGCIVKNQLLPKIYKYFENPNLSRTHLSKTPLINLSNIKNANLGHSKKRTWGGWVSGGNVQCHPLPYPTQLSLAIESLTMTRMRQEFILGDNLAYWESRCSLPRGRVAPVYI